MDNEKAPSGPIDVGLPKASSFSPAPPKPIPSSLIPTVANDATDRNDIFAQLVKDDADISGLVAYSIYKQNKLDWLRAFEGKTGRVPNEAELGAYIIGEATPRRLATYRHLAEATLVGNGPDVDGASVSRVPRRVVGADTKILTTGLLVTYALIAILFVIVLWFAAHFTAVSH